MRIARYALATAGLAFAVLHGAGPALADTEPSPVPAQRASSAPAPAAPDEVLPKGAPETGGGPAGSPLVPLGGALLLAGAGTALVTLRRRGHTPA